MILLFMFLYWLSFVFLKFVIKSDRIQINRYCNKTNRFNFKEVELEYNLIFLLTESFGQYDIWNIKLFIRKIQRYLRYAQA